VHVAQTWGLGLSVLGGAGGGAACEAVFDFGERVECAVEADWSLVLD